MPITKSLTSGLIAAGLLFAVGAGTSVAFSANSQARSGGSGVTFCVNNTTKVVTAGGSCGSGHTAISVAKTSAVAALQSEVKNATNGTNGTSGAQGPAGPAGPQGPAGPKGADGATGPAGATGATGPAGSGGGGGTCTALGQISLTSTGLDFTTCQLVGFNPAVPVNLQSANLTGVKMQYANWGASNFTNANMSSIDGLKANFYGANLTGANLTSANLTSANLQSTNFTNANLTNAVTTNAQY